MRVVFGQRIYDNRFIKIKTSILQYMILCLISSAVGNLKVDKFTTTIYKDRVVVNCIREI